ncbi:MAG: hypothetical protein ACRD8Z_03885 [Nitrososphaeraceae archaeon]
MIVNYVSFIQESMRILFTIITALVTGGLSVVALLGSQSTINTVSAAVDIEGAN